MKKLLLLLFCFMLSNTALANGYVEILGPTAKIDFDVNQNLLLLPTLYEHNYNITIINDLGIEAISIWAQSRPSDQYLCSVTSSDIRYFDFLNQVNMFGPGRSLFVAQNNGVCIEMYSFDTKVITDPGCLPGEPCPKPNDCLPGEPCPNPNDCLPGEPCPIPNDCLPGQPCPIPNDCLPGQPCPQPIKDCTLPGPCIVPTPPIL